MHVKKAAVDEQNSCLVRRSMIRYLTIIADFSVACLKQDLRPNRASVIKQVLLQFMQSFIDQNPLSKISLIVTMRQKALMLADFDKSVEQVMAALRGFDDFEGNPSMQQSLEFARIQIGKCVPDYALKEVLVINSSITICDPSDIHETIEYLARSRIICSVISLSAALRIL